MGGLGKEGFANIDLFSHFPKMGDPQFDTYDFDRFIRGKCRKISGDSNWFDVKFITDGTLLARNAPSGDCDDTNEDSWESHKFLLDVNNVRS